MKVLLSHIASLLRCSLGDEAVVRSVACDSREVGEGALFFAFRGACTDGHLFLEEVASRGAIAAVVDRSYRGPSFGLALLPVEDVGEALHFLAQQLLARRSPAPYVVGVTGSVGKTTTKEWIASLLGQRFRVGKTEGSRNSQIGFPLSLLQTAEDAEILVVEMGMSAPGQIARLTAIASPHIGVVTRIALVHAAFFSQSRSDCGC